MSDEYLSTVIRAASQYWGFPEVSVELIASRENRVYRISSDRNVLALRLHRVGYRSEIHILSELMWMEMLAKNGLSVPEPVPAVDGHYIHNINGWVVDVLTWLDGIPLSKIPVNDKIYQKLGAVLAQMHTLADHWQVPSTFDRPTWDLVGNNPTWDRFWDNPALNASQRLKLLAFRDQARDAIALLSDFDIGLVHADLVHDNVLLNDAELQLIDFDDGGYGFRIFDVSTITLKARRLKNSDQLIDALLCGYQSHRSLDVTKLPLFEAIRACSYVGWNIMRLRENGGAVRNGRFIDEALTAIDKYMEKL